MASNFPKFYSAFGPGKAFYQNIEKQGYVATGLDYRAILYYLTFRDRLIYQYENILSRTTIITESVKTYFDQSEVEDFGQNLPKSFLKKSVHMADITSKIPEISQVAFIPKVDKRIELKLKVVANTIPGKIYIQKTGVEIDIEQIGQKNFYARIHIPYWTSEPHTDEPALIIATSDLASLMYMLSLAPITYSEPNKQVLTSIFKFYRKQSKNDRDQLDLIYFLAPDFVLNNFDVDKELWPDLKNLLEGGINEAGTNEEIGILNIMASICSPSRLSEISSHNEEATAILDRLISEKVDDEPVFMTLYNKMNDYGGDNNFTALVDLLLDVWMLSTYYRTGPYEVSYDSRGGGLFYEDSYDFEISEDAKTIQVHSMEDGMEGEDIWTLDGTFNFFHRFVIPYPENVEVAEKETVPYAMPAFYLKALDDKNRSANIETGVFIALDALTAITGFGTLLRFRNLAAAFRATEEALLKGQIAAKIFVGGCEFTSGTASAMLTISKLDKTPFGQKIRECLLLLDILSLGTDAITSRLLKRTAGNLLDTHGNVPRQHFNHELVSLLEQLAERRALSTKLIEKADLENLVKTAVAKHNVPGVLQVCRKLEIQIVKNITPNPPPGIGIYQVVYKGKEVLDCNEEYLENLLRKFEELHGSNKSNGVRKYMDEILTASNARKLAFSKWLRKFDLSFFKHLDGEVWTLKKKKRINGKKQKITTAEGYGGHYENKKVQLQAGTVTNPDPLVFDSPFEAYIDIFDNGWYKKEHFSTMFPQGWTLQRIQEELAWVYENTVAIGDGMIPDSVVKKFKQFGFKDSSGTFNILIEVNDDLKIMNAYPIN
jgi:hypothetical protein